MILNGSKYLLISLTGLGLAFFIWNGGEEPFNPDHLSLDSKEEILALEETIIGHYADKIERNDYSKETLNENEMRVVLQSYDQNLQKQISNAEEESSETGLKLIASLNSPI